MAYRLGDIVLYTVGKRTILDLIGTACGRDGNLGGQWENEYIPQEAEVIGNVFDNPELLAVHKTALEYSF